MIQITSSTTRPEDSLKTLSTALPILRPGGLALTRRAVGICGFRAGDRVLDAGCGYGITAHYLAGRYNLSVTAVDIDPLKIKKSGPQPSGEHNTESADPGICFLIARLPAGPFKSRSYTGIICECVLSLVPDKASCLAEFHRILEPGGRLIVTDLYLKEPNRNRPAFGHSPLISCLDGAVSIDEIRDMTTAAGFEIVRIEDHTRLLNQMAGQMIFDHGSLDRLTGLLPRNLKPLPARERQSKGCPKTGYMMMTAIKPGIL